MTDGPALAIDGLTKRYGRRTAVPALDHLSLTVDRGTVFAFIGPNGAGKTTTLKLVLGLVRPTEGSATVLGGSIANRAIRARLGYLPEEPVLHPFLTVTDVLGFYGSLFGYTGTELHRRITETMALVGMSERKDDRMRDLSKGLRQRVLLGQSLINDPDLVLWDEPQSGLDPVGMQDLRHLMSELKNRGKTVFLNSHQLTEVEQVADRIGIIRGGILIREAATRELIGHEKSWVVVLTGIPAHHADELVGHYAEAAIDDILPVVFSMDDDGQQQFRCASEEIAQAVMAKAQQAGGRLISFQAAAGDLEDVFLDLIQGEGGHV